VNIPIGEDHNTTPLHLTSAERFLGTYIVGLMGVGKSTLIQSLICQQFADGAGCCVIEPHGQLVDELLPLIPRDRQKDVILLDFRNTEFVPGLDLFDTSKITSRLDRAKYVRGIVAAFRKTLGKETWGPRLENLLRCIAIAFLDTPGTTMAEMGLFLDNAEFRQSLTKNITSSREASRFWETFEKMKGKESYIESTQTKVREFLLDEWLRAVVGQPGKSLDFLDAIRTHKIVLIALTADTAGEDAMQLLGTILVSRLRSAASAQLSLPEEERTPFFLYLDEFQNFAPDDVEVFLAEFRKAKIGITMAHQWRDQIKSPDVKSAVTAAGNHIYFQVQTADAAVFARDFTYGPEVATTRYLTNVLNDLPAYMGERLPWPTHWPDKEILFGGGGDLRVATRAIRKMRSAVIELMLLSLDLAYWNLAEAMGTDDLVGCTDPYFLAMQEHGASDLLETTLEAVSDYCDEHGADEVRLSFAVLQDSDHRQLLHEKYAKWHRESPPLIDMLMEGIREVGEILARYPVPHNQPRLKQNTTTIAKALSQLPRFTALARLVKNGRTIEATLTTHLPPVPERAVDAEAVRDQARKRYCAPLDAILDAIDARHAKWDRPDEEAAGDDVFTLLDDPPKPTPFGRY